MTRALLILLPILLNGCNSEPAPPPDANVRVVPSGDAVMSKAIADAKANLSTFKEFLANPPKGSYLGVKVKMTAPTGTEHIWITDVSFANGKIKGKLDNDPVYLSKKTGDWVEVPESDLSDWVVFDAQGERVMGGYTIDAIEQSR